MSVKDKVKEKYTKSSITEDDIKKYLPLVSNIASKLSYNLPASIGYEDLVSVGLTGLMDAKAKFDNSKNVKFETYATYRIRGMILNYLQSLSWIPRNVREKSKKIQKVINNLSNRLERMPNDKEILNECGMNEEEYNKTLLEIAHISFIPIDVSLEDGEEIAFELKDYDTPEEKINKKFKINIIADTIKKLSEKEQLVISLYFYDDLNLKEIGDILDVSESRVSQILSSATLKLRGYLKDKL